MRKKTMRRRLVAGALAFALVISVGTLAPREVVQADYAITTNGGWVDGVTVKGEVRYYSFTLAKSGLVTVTAQSYSADPYVALMDNDLTHEYAKVMNDWDDGTETTPSTTTSSKNLEAGIYKIKVTGAWDDNSIKYRLKVDFAPANNNETEPNDLFNQSMPLNNNKLVTGFLSEDDNNDFYKFTIGSQTTVRITLNTGFGNPLYPEDGWYVLDDQHLTVWNGDFVQVMSDGNNSSGFIRMWEKTLPKGTYYIKMCRWNSRTGVYTLKWTGFNYVTKITLKKNSLVLKKGEKYGLLKSIQPSNATKKTIVWTSDNNSVATVDGNGNVKGKAVGIANITSKSVDGGNVQAVCRVIVTPAATKLKSCKIKSGRYIAVKVKKQNGVSGIEYQMCRKKNFKGKKATYDASSTETSIISKQLNKKKTYYVRARMYIDFDGKRYYGAWSNIKSAKTKKGGYNASYYYNSWGGI